MTVSTLDNAFSSDEGSDGEDIAARPVASKSSRYTIASTSRRHLMLGVMLAEVEDTPPPISVTLQAQRKASASLTNPPKRKSLLEQIDEDFPKTRSSRAARLSPEPAQPESPGPRRSKESPGPRHSVGVQPAPGSRRSLEVHAPRRVLEGITPPGASPAVREVTWAPNEVSAEKAPRRHPSIVWSQPVAMEPPLMPAPEEEEEEAEAEAEAVADEMADMPLGVDPPSGRQARRRVRKTGQKPPPEAEVEPAVWSAPAYAEWGQGNEWNEWSGGQGWEAQPYYMPQAEHGWQFQQELFAQAPMAMAMGVGMQMGRPAGSPYGMQIPYQMQMGIPSLPALALAQMQQHMQQQVQQQMHQLSQMQGLPFSMMTNPAFAQALSAGMGWAPTPAPVPAGQPPPPMGVPGSPGALPSSPVGRGAPVHEPSPARLIPSGKVPWGQLATVATDPKGSRSLQELLPRLPKQQLARARDELAPHIYSLSRHTFGNYLISKLATLTAMHETMTAAFRGNVVELLCHAQGSRVVQALLNAQYKADSINLVAEIDGHVSECAVDTHGSWGVCVAFSTTHAPFILQQMSEDVVGLSMQQHGCRVVQAIIQTAGAAGMDVSVAVNGVIAGGIEQLSLHRFANYAVQVALKHCTPTQCETMLSTLLPRLLAISTSKHGSNVAEVVLSLTSTRRLEPVAESIFGSTPASADALRQLMEHPFGNYVLQTLLKRLADPERRAAAVAKVRAATTTSNFGRSVLSRLGEADGEPAGRTEACNSIGLEPPARPR